MDKNRQLAMTAIHDLAVALTTVLRTDLERITQLTEALNKGDDVNWNDVPDTGKLLWELIEREAIDVLHKLKEQA